VRVKRKQDGKWGGGERTRIGLEKRVKGWEERMGGKKEWGKEAQEQKKKENRKKKKEPWEGLELLWGKKRRKGDWGLYPCFATYRAFFRLPYPPLVPC